MKITIDNELCKKTGLSLEEVFVALAVKLNCDLKTTVEKLLKREVIVSRTTLHEGNSHQEYYITQRWDDALSELLLDSENVSGKSDENLTQLAYKLMEIFPTGKKAGTNVYWRGNVKDTKLRLKKFYKLYGSQYTDDEILQAAKDYVASFNGNYSYMRVLKYFIWKDPVRETSDGVRFVEEVSDLATLLENKTKQPEETEQDWTTNVI